MTELDPNVDVPEVDAGEPIDEEPEGWQLLERLKELESDFDSQISDLKKTIEDMGEAIEDLERRVTELESNQSD